MIPKRLFSAKSAALLAAPMLYVPAFVAFEYLLFRLGHHSHEFFYGPRAVLAGINLAVMVASLLLAPLSTAAAVVATRRSQAEATPRASLALAWVLAASAMLVALATIQLLFVNRD